MLSPVDPQLLTVAGLVDFAVVAGDACTAVGTAEVVTTPAPTVDGSPLDDAPGLSRMSVAIPTSGLSSLMLIFSAISAAAVSTPGLVGAASSPPIDSPSDAEAAPQAGEGDAAGEG